jgi:hypothetical protein
MSEESPTVTSSKKVAFVAAAPIFAKLAAPFKENLDYKEYGYTGSPDFNRAKFRIDAKFSETAFSPVIATFNNLGALGLSVNSSATLSGVPTLKGFYRINFFQQDTENPLQERLNGTVTITVDFADPVLLTSTAFTSISNDTDQLFEFSNATDFHPGTITSATGLPSGLFFENNRLKGRHTTPGTFRAKVFFRGPTLSPVFSKEITIYNYEAGPSIFTSDLPSGKVGQGYSAELFTESANSPADSWTATGLPAGLVFSNGKISGTPSVFGNFDVVFTATNPLGSDSRTLTISISSGAPSIPIQTYTFKKSESISQAIALENAPNRPVTSWSASGLPTGLAINSSTGVVTGTPTDSGKYTSTIFAIGPGGGVSSEVVFLVRQSFSGKFADEFSQTPQIYETGSAKNWEVSGLPPGLEINSSTGGITGTPTAAGAFLAQLKITLQTDVEIVRGLDFAIAFGAPIISPDQQLNAALNVPFSRTPALEDGADRPATAWTSVGLPDWATLNPATGEITGTPTSDHGPITASLAATGPGGASESVDITFDTTGGIPILVPNQVFTAKVGVVFTPVIPASVDSANRPILEWAAFSLPDGLVINSATGEITGTPLLARTRKTTLRVTGEGGSIATASIIFEIDFGAPLLSPDQNCLFKFGVPFTKTFKLQDAYNRPVALWSATGLPDWAVLDSATGQLTGDAASIGISTFILTATGSGGSSTQIITLAISAGVPKLTEGESVAGIATAFLSFNPTPVDTTNRPITSWSAKGLPAGVSISASTGEITGTPLVFWSAPAKITAVGPGGSATEELLFDITRLERTTNVRIYAAPNRFPLEVSGSRKVQVFSTNLVMVSLEYLVPRNDEYLYSQQFTVGNPLLTDSPAVDGLFIFPAASRQDMGNGFVKFMVSAYGRSSTEWNTSLRFVSLGSAQTFLTSVTLADEPFPLSVLGEKVVISTNINNFGRFNEFEIVAR